MDGKLRDEQLDDSYLWKAKWKWYTHIDKETSKNILWILCIDWARGKENTCYVLCVSPGWEVSLLSINVCLLFMNSLTRYVTITEKLKWTYKNLDIISYNWWWKNGEPLFPFQFSNCQFWRVLNWKHTDTLKSSMHNPANISSKKYSNSCSMICKHNIQVNLSLYRPRIEFIKLEPGGWLAE